MLIQFNNRTKFNLAISFIRDKEDVANTDIGYSEMMVSFFNEETYLGIIGEWSAAQIWPHPSFRSKTGDFEIIKDGYDGIKWVN